MSRPAERVVTTSAGRASNGSSDAGVDQGLVADDEDKLIKIGAKVVSHGCYVIFQVAEVTRTASGSSRSYGRSHH